MIELSCVLLLQICTQDYTPVSYDGGESYLHLAACCVYMIAFGAAIWC